MLCVDSDEGAMKAISSLFTGSIHVSVSVPAKCYGTQVMQFVPLKFIDCLERSNAEVTVKAPLLLTPKPSKGVLQLCQFGLSADK